MYTHLSITAIDLSVRFYLGEILSLHKEKGKTITANYVCVYMHLAVRIGCTNMWNNF